MGPSEHSRTAAHATLRAALTDSEYRRVVRQLRGAVAAVQLLALRSPESVQEFFPLRANPPDIPSRVWSALDDLIGELRASRRQLRVTTSSVPKPLRLVR